MAAKGQRYSANREKAAGVNRRPHLSSSGCARSATVVEPCTFWPRPIFGAKALEVTMIAITKVLSRAFPATSPQADILKHLALFCGAALLVSLMLMTYGLDLSVGFF
jgi:hypothetical protein